MKHACKQIAKEPYIVKKGGCGDQYWIVYFVDGRKKEKPVLIVDYCPWCGVKLYAN